MALGKDAEALDAADEVVRKAGDADSRLHYRLFRAEMLSQAGKHAEAEVECLALMKEYNTAGDVREVRMVLSMAYTAAHKPEKSEEQLAAGPQGRPERRRGQQRPGLPVGRPQQEPRRGGADDPQGARPGPQAAHARATNWSSTATRTMRPTWTASAGCCSAAASWPRRGASWSGPCRCKAVPTAPEVWDHLGDVYFRSQMPAKAGDAWRKAVGLYETVRRRPDDRLPEIKEKLRQLKP